MLDTHQLNVFLVAAETLNFTQAARLLHMSQPSVSQHIQSLEQHFDHPLFLRTGRRIELTDAGRELVPLAEEMVRRSDEIELAMKSLKGEIHGHLLVGCSTTPGKYVLPNILTRFHGLHPKVHVTCQVSAQNQSLERLMQGDLHFALSSMPRDSVHDLEFARYMTDQIQLIVPLDHPWAQREWIEPEELFNGRFILRESESGTQRVVRQALASAGISADDLKTILVLGNSEAIALAVQEGLGAGFVSSSVVKRLVLDQVATVKISGLALERDILLARNTRRTPTKAQIAFWEFVNNEGAVEAQVPPLPEAALSI